MNDSRHELVNTRLNGDKHIQIWQERRHGFHGKSTAHDTFVAHDNQRPPELSTVARATNIPLKDAASFYGETTSRSMYQAPKPEDLVRPRVIEQKYEPSPAKFYASTTNAETYRYSGGEPSSQSEVARRTSIPIQQDNRFYSQTTANSTYVPYGSVERPAATVPNNRSLEGVMDYGESNFNTTSRSTYVAFPVEPKDAPKVVYEPNKAYFYGSTTAGEAFQPWKVEKPERARGPAHKSESGPFYGSTTNRDMYLAHNSARQQSCAPVDHLKSEGNFQGVTTSRETFQGWQLPKHRTSLGLETVNDTYFVMIPKNKQFPTQFSQCFTTVTDNQGSVEIVVRQGDSMHASANPTLGSFELVGIPPMRVGEAQIIVTFHINEHGVLHVDARDKLTGKHHAIAIDKTKNYNAFG